MFSAEIFDKVGKIKIRRRAPLCAEDHNQAQYLVNFKSVVFRRGWFRVMRPLYLGLFEVDDHASQRTRLERIEYKF
jgi:hypothetical protein